MGPKHSQTQISGKGRQCCRGGGVEGPGWGGEGGGRRRRRRRGRLRGVQGVGGVFWALRPPRPSGAVWGLLARLQAAAGAGVVHRALPCDDTGLVLT